MKRLMLIMAIAAMAIPSGAQVKKSVPAKVPANNTLPELHQCILEAQEHTSLFTQNLDSNSVENNVNGIVLDMQGHIDSLPGGKSRSDVLLLKYYAPLRLFFLTTTNKTTVATGFLYAGTPYRFCLYGDSLALYLGAVKDGEIYNLAKTTEKRIAQQALMNCLLPSLKALDEFKEGDIKYVGLSIYYGCRDTREGAPAAPVTAYCLTLVARMTDIREYTSGIITAKGLLENASLYLGDDTDHSGLRKIQISVD